MGGSWIGLGSAIDFSAGKIFRMKVYSPRVGAKVLLKIENASNNSNLFEKEATATKGNEWEIWCLISVLSIPLMHIIIL
jgi:hypothetical protein